MKRLTLLAIFAVAGSTIFAQEYKHIESLDFTYRIVSTDYDDQSRLTLGLIGNYARAFWGLNKFPRSDREIPQRYYGSALLRWTQPGLFSLSAFFSPAIGRFTNNPVHEIGFSGMIYAFKISNHERFFWPLKMEFDGTSGNTNYYTMHGVKLQGVEKRFSFGPVFSFTSTGHPMGLENEAMTLDDERVTVAYQDLSFGIGMEIGRNVKSQIQKRLKEYYKNQAYKTLVKVEYHMYLNTEILTTNLNADQVESIENRFKNSGISISLGRYEPVRFFRPNFTWFYSFGIKTSVDGKFNYTVNIGIELGLL